MPTLYRKTAKGLIEIETRANRLPPRLRSLLILVDGRRSDEELRRTFPQQADESLIALVGDGFIEVVSVADSAPAPRTATRPPTAAAPTRPAAPVAAASTMPASLPPLTEFSTLRREAVRALNNEVGPVAEALAIRMERAREWDELRPLIDKALGLIADVRGRAAATAYQQRFVED